MKTDNSIIKPIITEKSMADVALGKFTFAVVPDAGKRDIKRDIEKAFKVTVMHVATMMVKGKTKRVGTRRQEVTLTPGKKAIVKLAKGQKIDLFDMGGQQG